MSENKKNNNKPKIEPVIINTKVISPSLDEVIVNEKQLPSTGVIKNDAKDQKQE